MADDQPTFKKIDKDDQRFDANEEKFEVFTPGISSPTVGTKQVFTIPMLNSTIESLKIRKVLEIQRWDDRIAKWEATRDELLKLSDGKNSNDPGPPPVSEEMLAKYQDTSNQGGIVKNDSNSDENSP